MAALQELYNLWVLPDLRKAAQAGKIDGAFMTACCDGERSLKAFVFDNSELWTGWDDCLNEPVSIGETDDESVERWKMFLVGDGSDMKHRVRWPKETQLCNCEGYDAYHLCASRVTIRNDCGFPSKPPNSRPLPASSLRVLCISCSPA